MWNKQIFIKLRLLFRILIPIVLLILPGNYFDNGRSICLSQLLFHLDCPACGLTRACMHLIHFQFEDAYAYNMFSFISFPVLAIIWTYLFIKDVNLYKGVNKYNLSTVKKSDK